jgi:ATP-dependent protease ClpP protease subunit
MTVHPLSASLRAALARANPAAAKTVAGRMTVTAAGKDDVELLIYGNIGASWWDDESVTAKSVVEQLQGIDAGTIRVRINSYGGSVSDGVAIHNELRRHAARGTTIDVTVDGAACSIASLIAMAGDKITMPSNALMMLHAPWGSLYIDGNAKAVRELAEEFASVLETFGKAMAQSYARKTGKPAAEFESMWDTGKDYWYDAASAKAFGLCDSVIDAGAEAEEEDNDDEQASAAALQDLIARAPEALRLNLRAAFRAPEPTAAHAAAPVPQAPARESLPATAGAPTGVIPMPNPTDTAVAEASAAATQAALVAMRTRNTEIQALAATCPDDANVQAYVQQVIADANPEITAGDVGKEILRIQAKGRQPLGGGARVEAGADETDRFREAGVNAILARSGTLPSDEAIRARQGNPLANASLLDIAEQSLIRAGLHTRSMSRDDIASRILAAGQSTSDFAVLLENALHKIIVANYNAQPWTWNRFCKIGTLSDYRPHGRYQLSSFSDLAAVNEAGEYTNGTLGDGAKESITGQRKGRILELTPEVLVNDDLGFLVDLAGTLGRAAGRTIEKDVYALLALNSGAGPTMADGQPLFYASRASGTNIDSTSAAPTVTSLDASANILRSQKDIAGNDFLDLEPAIWLGPVTKAGAARAVVNSEYDPDATSKLQRFNIARNIVRDVVASPRLSGNRWYMFADPNVAPVLEVAFLNGVREPQIRQDENFRSEGLAWRVTHKYGAGAVSTIGAVTNAGA